MANQTVDIASFEATLQGVLLDIGLRLDTVEIKGSGLHIESNPIAASVPEPGLMSVTVLQESLATYLDHESPGGLRDFDVTIQDGKLIIQATKSMLIDVRAAAVCTLRIVDQSELHVDLESVDVFGGGGLTNLVRSQIEAINPIFTANDLPVKAKLTDVRAEAGRVVLKGTIEP